MSKTGLPRRHFLGRLLAGLAGLSLPWGMGRARAQEETQGVEPYMGEIRIFAFGWAPRGWGQCNGQLLPINQNQALFSLLLTRYGGNGQTNFALPDLRGRVPIHQGQGVGLTNRALGSSVGEAAHVLTPDEMPAHSHIARCSSQAGTTSDGGHGVVPARNPAGIPQWGTNTASAMSAMAVTSAGSSQPHNNLQPYTVLQYTISLQGIYPFPEKTRQDAR